MGTETGTGPDGSGASAPAWQRYGTAFVVVGAAALLRWRLGSVIGNSAPFILFFPAVAVTGWLAGLGPGLAAIAVSVAVVLFWFMRPLAPGPELAGDLVRLFLFLFVSLLLVLLIEAVRRQGVSVQAHARHAIQAERQWRSLVENTTDLITVADGEGRIRFANRDAPPAGDHTVFDRVPPEHHDLMRRELAQVVDEGRPGLFEVEAVGPDGTRGWYESRLVPLATEAGEARVLAITRDVTERRRYQQSLHESAARYQALFEGTLDSMVLADDEGRIVEANPAAAALFGEPVEKLVGTGIWEWSDDRSAFDAAWARFLADGTMRGEWELRLADGSTRQVEFSATAGFLSRRHLSMLRDVTERRRGERTVQFLARATRLLGSSLEERDTALALARLAVPEVADWCGVDLQGEDGRLVRVALALADTRQEEAAWDLVRRAPPDGVGGATLEASLRTGEPFLLEEGAAGTLAAKARDDEHRQALKAAGWRSVMVVPLASSGRMLGVLWFAGIRRALGAPELALARELADRAGVALENARLYREAQEANRVKDEFLATLSHELRTPLNAIVGWTYLLRTGGLDAATSQRALETIERNARLQSQLIADILDVSRIVSGKLRIENTPVELAQLLAAAVDTVRPAAQAKGVSLQVEVAPGGASVLGDGGRLHQVAQNLLNNAVKFTGAGGEVRVALRRAATMAELVVADTGVGIPADFLPHVFERFRQGDSSTTRPHGGLGLGLAITRHLVEAHGGSVEAASDGPGRGSRFTIRLPLAEVGGAGEARASAPRRAAPELSGVRVLVVDDHADGLDALGAILERAGAAVARAGSSQEAFAALQGFRPHVLVSDVGLPDEDGYALVGRMRALPAEHGGNIPALAVIGDGRDEERTRAMSVGFQQHLSRPVDPEKLAWAVAQLALRAPRTSAPD